MQPTYLALFPAVLVMLLQSLTSPVRAQDYEVADVRCSTDPGEGERLSARLRRPAAFRGYPQFADARPVDPRLDPHCQIHPDPADPQQQIFSLLITDLSRCGVLKRNGFVNVRIWFPQLPGVVMLSDQEVIIMCKPPQDTVVEERSAAFAGSLPPSARISGVVEEAPARLDYDVQLYRQATAGGAFSLLVQGTEPVPIGTPLQLRASINPQLSAGWRYAKLLEVTVSASKEDPYAPGHVLLVQDSCRNPELTSIVLTQPQQNAERPQEVSLTLEAFLLAEPQQSPAAQLWLHTRLLACARQTDCKPDFCLDLFQPSGYGRRRRSVLPPDANLTSFGDNVGLRVVIPEEFYVAAGRLQSSCASFTVLVALLACFLVISCGLMCFLALRLQRALASQKHQSLDDVIYQHIQRYDLERERVRKLHTANLDNPEYTDTSTVSAISGQY